MKTALFATELLRTASLFVGLTETSSNAAWDDPRTKASEKPKSDLLVKYMRRVRGWTPGAAYCVAFDGAVIALTLEALKEPAAAKKFLKAWTAHVMTNVREMKRRECLSKTPTYGSVWLANHKGTDKGHGGFVNGIMVTTMGTVEGNTSAGATADPELQRNGDGIFTRVRNKDVNGSLITQGFVSPAAILRLAGLVPED